MLFAHSNCIDHKIIWDTQSLTIYRIVYYVDNEYPMDILYDIIKSKGSQNFYSSHSKLKIMFFTLYISFGPVYELQYVENNHTIPGNIHCICIRLKT